MAKIYVASSWKNPYQHQVVELLRSAGHKVYDFRNPPHGKGGFSWTSVSPNWQNWKFNDFAKGLKSKPASMGFKADFDALKWAEVCVLILPCGKSAHTEAGWMSGAGKKVIAYIPDYQEPELMYNLFDFITNDINQIIDDLK